MRKLAMLLLVAFCVTVVESSAFAATKNSLKGTWEYKVAEAPYQYRSGKLVFAEANGQQTITIKFTDGTEIKAKEIKIENNTFSFAVEVESNPVTVTGKVAEGKMSGKIDSPQGPMDLTAVQKP